jgi:PKD repeat protein
MKFKFILISIALIFLISPILANPDYYAVPVASASNSPADAATVYFGNKPGSIPGTTVNLSISYIPQNGYLDTAEIYDYSGTAGTNEVYSYYIRINNTADYLVKTLSVNTNERIFSNTSMNVQVFAGDYYEIKRVQPTWATNPATNIVGGYLLFNSTTIHGYYLPLEALSSSPADSVRNYMGYRPIAASTTQGTNKIYIRWSGNISRGDIIMNSTLLNGTNEATTYYVQKNGGETRFIGSVANNLTKNRLFSNTNLNLHVDRGDYVEVYRDNPAWVINPTGVTDNGGLWVDTSNDCGSDGYKLYAQAITSSPTDAQTVYIGTKPTAPDTTAARDNMYIRKAGTINSIFLYVYSGTAGTSEDWKMYIRKNNANDYYIATVNASANERMFRNATMGLSVAAGDYLQFKGVQPTWATNPATTIYGGWVFVEITGDNCKGGGGDIILPPVSNFSANITSTTTGSTLKFFDQSNNTVPGTTAYYWNFVDGSTTVNSTDVNPTFIYAEAGTYTINHTISSGGVISKSTGVITITGGGTPTGPPNASFNIILSDTSTNYPTSWKWNATNLLGNNTEVTFSTSQNPIMNFGTGNWRINFTSTNALGSNTTNQTIGWNLSSPKVYYWSRTA